MKSRRKRSDLIYKDNDILYVSIHSLHRIAKYTGQRRNAFRTLHKLGSVDMGNIKAEDKKESKGYRERSHSTYAKRSAQKGFAFSPDHYPAN